MLHISQRLKIPTPRDIKSNNEDHVQKDNPVGYPIPTPRLTNTSCRFEPKTHLTVVSKVRHPEPTRQTKTTQSAVKNGPIEGVEGLDDISNHNMQLIPPTLVKTPQCPKQWKNQASAEDRPWPRLKTDLGNHLSTHTTVTKPKGSPEPVDNPKNTKGSPTKRGGITICLRDHGNISIQWTMRPNTSGLNQLWEWKSLTSFQSQPTVDF